MRYISERIVNISELEKQIQNAKLHFDILKEELKNTAPSATIDSAVYQIDRSLKAAIEFEFCLKKVTENIQDPNTDARDRYTKEKKCCYWSLYHFWCNFNIYFSILGTENKS